MTGKNVSKLRVADLELNKRNFEAKRAERISHLSPHELKLLELLMTNAGNVLSRGVIFEKVWHFSENAKSRVVDVYIGYLRKKIDFGFDKKLLHSVRGLGYMIKE